MVGWCGAFLSLLKVSSSRSDLHGQCFFTDSVPQFALETLRRSPCPSHLIIIIIIIVTTIIITIIANRDCYIAGLVQTYSFLRFSCAAAAAAVKASVTGIWGVLGGMAAVIPWLCSFATTAQVRLYFEGRRCCLKCRRVDGLGTRRCRMLVCYKKLCFWVGMDDHHGSTVR